MARNDRRDFLGAALLGAAGSSLTRLEGESVAAADEEPRVQARGLFPDGAPAAAPGYSPGIVAEGRRVVFISGQGPKDLGADTETQVRQAFDHIGLVLKAAGASFGDVVMIRAYFLHLHRDLSAYRKVRMEYLKEPYPASTAVGVTELAVAGLEIEIEAVAIV
jgi:enamine deaminase RidA (YjgF/YER057c/UK114 family)